MPKCRSIRSACLVLAGLGLVAVLGACGGSGPAGIRHDLTPNLDTQVNRYRDTDNMFWHTWNGNMRAGWDDYYRGALIDRPTRLSRYPSPH